MPFSDRTDAGKQLAQALSKYRGQSICVYALPRGGVMVAAEIARALGAPLDVLLVRKIGVPTQPELAMGAVVDGGAPIVVRNEDVVRLTGMRQGDFDRICQLELAEIERRRRRYVQNRPALNPEGKVAIVVDDGIATGATMSAALQATRRRGPSKLVLAVPVAAADSLEILRDDVDEVVCLEVPEHFGALGYFYQDFHQLSDEDVVETLQRFPLASA